MWNLSSNSSPPSTTVSTRSIFIFKTTSSSKSALDRERKVSNFSVSKGFDREGSLIGTYPPAWSTSSHSRSGGYAFFLKFLKIPLSTNSAIGSEGVYSNSDSTAFPLFLSTSFVSGFAQSGNVSTGGTACFRKVIRGPSPFRAHSGRPEERPPAAEVGDTDTGLPCPGFSQGTPRGGPDRDVVELTPVSLPGRGVVLLPGSRRARVGNRLLKRGEGKISLLSLSDLAQNLSSGNSRLDHLRDLYAGRPRADGHQS